MTATRNLKEKVGYVTSCNFVSSDTAVTALKLIFVLVWCGIAKSEKI